MLNKVPFVCSLLRNSLNVGFSKNIYGTFIGRRTLYSHKSLGMDTFSEQKFDTERYLLDGKSDFKERIKAAYGNPSKIVTYQDIIQFIHISVGSEDDIKIILELSKRSQESPDLQVQHPFNIGPFIIRLLYFFGNYHKIYEILLDEQYGPLFNTASSYQIAMDLLFKNQCYSQVLNILNHLVVTKPISLPLSSINLGMASLYKINTEESLNETVKVFEACVPLVKQVTIRSVSFAAGLALTHSKPELARQFLSYARTPNHFLIKNLELKALAQLGYLSEALSIMHHATPLLPSVSPHERSIKPKYFFLTEVIEAVERKIYERENLDITSKFSNYKNILKQGNMISNQSLDSALMSTIDVLSDKFLEIKIRGRKGVGVSDRREGWEGLSDRRKEGIGGADTL